MNILITGGLGYIGSNLAMRLWKKGNKIVVVDNCSRCEEENENIIKRISKGEIKVYKQDIYERTPMKKILKENKIDLVIHCAGYKNILESMRNRSMYKFNNVGGTVMLLKAMETAEVNNLIFSSSASIYKEQDKAIKEGDTIEIRNPYAESKYEIEQIMAREYPGWNITILRYFNPLGDEVPEMRRTKSGNIIDVIRKCRAKDITFKIRGGDFNTPDGTAIRDYIYMGDLIDAHIKVMEKGTPGLKIYNVGSGKGTTVKQLIDAYNKINKCKVKYSIGERKGSEAGISLADISKIKKELKWKPKGTLEQMLKEI